MKFTWRNKIQGMTLIELMIAMVILALFSMTAISAALLSRRISEAAVYESTAITVAQGYLEQIKSMPYSELEYSINNPGTPLGTKSVSAIAAEEGGDIQVEDPLFLYQLNEKEVLIDIRTSGNEIADSTNARMITMPYRITPTLTDLNNGTNPIRAVEIVLDYEYLSPETGTPQWKKGSVRSVRSWVPSF